MQPGESYPDGSGGKETVQHWAHGSSPIDRAKFVALREIRPSNREERDTNSLLSGCRQEARSVM